MLHRLIYFCIIFCLVNATVYAQEDIRFYKLNAEQGLSQSVVTAIIQDQKGFFWFGTQSGLNRYDGYHIKTYFFNPRDTNSISDSWINALLNDKAGNIWIGTKNGLTCYNPKTNQYKRFRHSLFNASSLPDNNVTCLAYSQNNNILWVGTAKGLCRINLPANSIERISFRDAGYEIPPSINNLLLDDKQDIWIASDNAMLLKLNSQTLKVDKYQYLNRNSEVSSVYNMVWWHNSILLATEDGLRFFDTLTKNFIDRISPVSNGSHLVNKPVNRIYKESDDVFILGAHYGPSLYEIDRLNFSTNNCTRHPGNDTDPYAFSNEAIYSIFRDNYGVYWVGTYGKGINYFNPSQRKFIHYTKDNTRPNWLKNEYIFSIYEENPANIWIGSSGGSLYRFDKTREFFTRFTDKFYDDNRVSVIAPASDNKLWVGHSSRSNGKLALIDKTSGKETPFNEISNDPGLREQRIKCITTATDGNVYIGTANKGLAIYNPATKSVSYLTADASGNKGIADNEINDVIQDSKKNIWVGTPNGLSKIDKSGKITNYKYSATDSNSISNNRVLSVFEDSEKQIWVSTGFGLNLFDQSASSFKTYTKKEGLPDNYIYGVLEDSKSNLWISTNNGLCRFNTTTHSIRNFDVSDGLQSKEFNTHAFHKGNSGWMYFGGINGLNIFFPDSIKDNILQPNLLLTSFKKFGLEVEIDTPIAYKKHILLNYNENFLGFEFASVDYLIPDKNLYACKMDGFDKDWITLGNQHSITYTNLDPGNYVFRVRGTNNDGVWNNEGVSILITVKPPFWKSPLFYTLAVLLSLVVIYGYIKFRERKITKEKRNLELNVIERTSMLIAERDKVVNLNLEITAQNDAILFQRNEIEKQKTQLETKNKEVFDSIEYAHRIQSALLPSQQQINKYIPENFIFFLPKDIVSGDFYWALPAKTEADPVNPLFYFITADCTGHGVPGAFMSLLNHAFLNEVVKVKKVYGPGQILDEVRNLLVLTLNKQSTGETQNKDGMDCVLCCFDMANMKLTYAAANNALWIYRAGEILEFSSDKMPVGRYMEEQTSFKETTINLQKGDIIYTFTDGFADQFGGEKGKKFKYKALKELLLSVAGLPLHKQSEILGQRFIEWKGDYEQVDDVCVIGMKV